MKTLLKNLLIWLPILATDRLLRLFVTSTMPRRTGVWYPETFGLYLDNLQHPKLLELGYTFPLISQYPRIFLFVFLCGAVSGVLVVLWKIKDSRLLGVFTPMIFGMVSNLFDLWVWNSATDPIIYATADFGLAFNIADLCLIIGFFAFVALFIKRYTDSRRSAENWRILFVGSTKKEYAGFIG